MIGAVERQKLVYIMNRDSEAHLTISSPLEAHKHHTLCYAMVGIDVGFENPTFACLEFDYEVMKQDRIFILKTTTIFRFYIIVEEGNFRCEDFVQKGYLVD